MSKRRNKKQEQIVFATLILRRERDADNLLAGREAGDAFCLHFHDGLVQWLTMWEEAQDRPQDKSPVCLTCEHEFRSEAPHTFMMAFSEDPRVKHMILTGVCDSCAAEKSDRELLKVGTAGVCRVLGGKIIGFDSPTTNSIN